MQLSSFSYKAYRLRPSLAAAPGVDRAGSLSRLDSQHRSSPGPLLTFTTSISRLHPAISRVLSSTTAATATGPAPPHGAAPLLVPNPDWRVAIFFPCVLEDPFAEDIKVHALEEAMGAGPNGGAAAAAAGARVSSAGLRRQQTAARQQAQSLRRLREFGWAELASPQGAAFSVLVQPEVSRHALVRVSDGRGVEVGQGVLCLRHAFSASGEDGDEDEEEGKDGGGRRRGFRAAAAWVNRLAAEPGQPAPGSEVKVLLTSGGRAVGVLRVHVKIRCHK